MIFIPFSAFLFAYYFVNVAGFPQAIKKGFKMMPHQRIKPIDCVTCLSVWTAVILFMLPIKITYFIGAIFGAGYLGVKMK